VREIQQAGPQPAALGTHHQNRRVLGHGAVARGEALGAARERVHDCSDGRVVLGRRVIGGSGWV
jgi:hypothetical protein